MCRYSETGDFAAARAVQQTLLADYEHDFSKHVESALEVERIHQTWHSVPVQLARESDLRRFSYASVEKADAGGTIEMLSHGLSMLAWLLGFRV